MELMELYFSTSGRINRSTFWLKGVLLLNVIWVFDIRILPLIPLSLIAS